jgi:hypothetical protein
MLADLHTTVDQTGGKKQWRRKTSIRRHGTTIQRRWIRFDGAGPRFNDAGLDSTKMYLDSTTADLDSTARLLMKVRLEEVRGSNDNNSGRRKKGARVKTTARVEDGESGVNSGVEDGGRQKVGMHRRGRGRQWVSEEEEDGRSVRVGVGEKRRRMVVTSPLKNTRSSYRSVQPTKHEHNKSDYL